MNYPGYRFSKHLHYFRMRYGHVKFVLNKAYVKEHRQKVPKFSSSYNSIKDRLRSSVAFLIKEEGSALSFYQKLVPKYFRRVFFIYN